METINSFSVPIVMLKEEDKFIISCDTLGIYSQSSTAEDAKLRFTECANVLLNKWGRENKLESTLKKKVKLMPINMKNLKEPQQKDPTNLG